MHKWADVLRAIADGKEVQWKSFATGEWNDVAYGAKVNPIIDTHLEWRIKPAPKQDFVRYLSIFNISGYDQAAKHTNVAATFDGVTGTIKKVELVK